MLFKFNSLLFNIKLKEKGLSNTELIKKLGITFATLGTWKRGTNYPSGVNLQNFCRLLDVEADEIFIKPDKEVDGKEVTSAVKLNEAMLNRMALQKVLLGAAFSLSELNNVLMADDNLTVSDETADVLMQKSDELFSLIWDVLSKEIIKVK